MNAPELQDYDIMEEIGSGRISTVYLVNCKRGRLRNRQLALRTVSVERVGVAKLSESLAIWQSLYHPCIVSLFSTFSTPSTQFYLLELCLGGTLACYLKDHSVSEAHLRGILKTLIEALMYLKKQDIVHRKITPSNLLLTADGRMKLSNFDLATRMPPSRIPADCFMMDPHFVAPEILAGLPYTCDADLWSVGCISITCLSGRRPFEANSNPEVVDKILDASYVLPGTTCLELQDLVLKLLQIEPIRRMQLAAILAHPFFDAKLPQLPLNSTPSKTSESVLSKQALFESNSGLPKTSILGFPSSHRKPNRLSFAPNKTVIDDIRNTNRRNALRNEIPARRIVSDPLPLEQRHLTPEAAPSNISQHKTPLQTACQNDQGRGPTDGLVQNPVLAHNSDLPDSPSTLPVGTTKPLPFTTALLSPEVHKTVHGQITILPSCSLLADLREGERRRGQKGMEVLLIDSRGMEIEVYNAPHLSVPCCLAEPTKRYTIENLPSVYWRQYNDTGRLVQRIKQRTPRLTLHTDMAKCTLMANVPRADIELLFGASATHIRRTAESSAETFDAPRIRIRISRQCGSLEIAQHITGDRGEEWTKRVLKCSDEYPHISIADWEALDATEQDSMRHLARFWRICEFLEKLENEDTPAPYPSGSPDASKSRSRTLHTTDPPNANIQSRVAPASFSSTQTLSLVNVAPRPSKLAFTPTATRKITPSRSPSDMASIEQQHLSVISKTTILPTWCRDDLDLTTADHRATQTKFIPSVGWCIRHNSRVSQGGRYKIMFFDGAVLEIDVDEDWAELTTPAGGTTRHNIRECNAKRHIAERMRVFGEFVSMFDDETER